MNQTTTVSLLLKADKDLSDIINAQYNGSRKGMSLWEYAETHEDYDDDWGDDDD